MTERGTEITVRLMGISGRGCSLNLLFYLAIHLLIYAWNECQGKDIDCQENGQKLIHRLSSGMTKITIIYF